MKRTSRKPKRTSRKPRHHHVLDNQGLCHWCGKLMDRERWEAYAGRGAPAPRRNGSDEVARIILQQLGGIGRLRMMIGAKDFVALPNGVMFGWPGKKTVGMGVNKIVIKLEPSDTYRVEFWWVRAGKSEMILEYDDIYADQLAPLFERTTGLRLSLGTMGRNKRKRRSR